MYFAPYNKQAGFKIAIDGLHNCPNAIPYGTIFSLAPPGDLYNGNASDAEVNFAATVDWKAKIRSPRFLDGFYHFRDIAAQANLSIVVDVRSAEYSGVNVTLREAGWCILPLFKKHEKKMYVRSGYYQVPLLRSPVNKDVL